MCIRNALCNGLCECNTGQSAPSTMEVGTVGPDCDDGAIDACSAAPNESGW